MSKLTKARVRDTVTLAYRMLERACEEHRLERQLAELHATVDRQERAHMAFGRSLVGRPTRLQPHEIRVRYFVVKAVAMRHDPRSKGVIGALAELCELRSDVQLGAMLSCKLQKLGARQVASEAFAKLDYKEHFAG